MEVADKGQVHVQRQVEVGEGIQEEQHHVVDLEEEDMAQYQDGQRDEVHVDADDEVHEDVAHAHDEVHVDADEVHVDADEVHGDEIQSDGVDAKV